MSHAKSNECAKCVDTVAGISRAGSGGNLVRELSPIGRLQQDHRSCGYGRGDSVEVAAGTYAESVVIGKSLNLFGANPSTTIINAAGLSTGIYVDGLDNPNLSGVLISGFTVQNASFEGTISRPGDRIVNP
jgi:hypothetical protein